MDDVFTGTASLVDVKDEGYFSIINVSDDTYALVYNIPEPAELAALLALIALGFATYRKRK